ncbi:MAG TPA: rhomboid family intramembrane serine protease [Bacillota bacterium]|nr:rhomboid family intramembrane serine protease [Bacillota bacterium]
MLFNSLYKKRIGIPFLSLILAYSCILVSVTTYFNPEYYDIFGGQGPVFYTWQHLTRYLDHGASIGHVGMLNPLLQLLLNVLVLLTFGVICERVLGTKRFFILIAGSILISQLLRFFLKIWVSGPSSIVWAFTPILFLTLLHLYKRDRAKILKDPMAYFSLLLLIIMWFVIPTASFIKGWRINSLVLSLSTLVGVSFAYVWQDFIYGRIDYLLTNYTQASNRDIVDKGISSMSFALPCFIIAILISSLSGILTEHVSPANIVEIYPTSGTIEDFNNADNKIMIRFSGDMDTREIQTNIDHISDDEAGIIYNNLIWKDDRTIEISFSRQLGKEEHISVLLQGLRDIENKGYYDVIRLDYGSNVDD